MKLKFLSVFLLTIAGLNAEVDTDEMAKSSSFPVCMPNELIEGKVSVITGQAYIYEEDLVIAGVEPIRIPRVNGHVLLHLKAICKHNPNGSPIEIKINESNGTVFSYQNYNNSHK